MRQARDDDVTVVIPTRDRWTWLRGAVANALAQDGVAVRVVVVDDGSQVAAGGPLPELADPRVRVVHLPVSLGVSAARNRGLDEVDTPWVAFLDDDDRWAPSHLATMLEAARSAAAELVYSGCVQTDETGRPLHAWSPAPSEHLDLLLHRWNALGAPACVLVRTTIVRALGGFDKELSILADWDLWLRIVRSGRRVARSEHMSVAYTVHAGNMHRAMGDALAELERLRSRHGSHAESRGVRLPGSAFWLWAARSHRTNGDRLRAAGAYARSFRHSRNPGDLARAAAALLLETGPHPFDRRRLRRVQEDERIAWLRPPVDYAASNPRPVAPVLPIPKQAP